MSRTCGSGARGWMMRLGLMTALLAPTGSQARTLHVDLYSRDPQPPYLTRTTAARTIQDAVDAAVDGDVIRVSPGHYDQGGSLRDGQLNRVVVDKAITVSSVQGAQATTIAGARDPNAAPEDHGCGPLAVRGVYLDHPQAKLVGFRVTGGATRAWDPWDDEDVGLDGGGVYAANPGAVIAQCTLDGNAAGGSGGGFQGGLARKCVLAANWARRGGGAAQAELTDSRLVGNTAQSGGGAYECVLRRCEIRDNIADCECEDPDSMGGGIDYSQAYDSILHHNMAITSGGGAYLSELWNCTVSDNVSSSGGGAAGGTLRNCILTGNRATEDGGGTHSGVTYDCIFRGNRSYVAGACESGRHSNALMIDNVADYQGGAAYFAHLYNCTIVSNRSLKRAGGTYHCLHVNTIVYDNRADGAPETDNWEVWPNSYWPGDIAFYNSCTTPLPPGPGNLDVPPGFQTDEVQAWMDWSGYRLAADSPCVDAGSDTMLTNHPATDLGGLPRIAGAQIDIGAYEQQNPAPPSDAVYVDAAQAASPVQDGSRRHPFGTIQAGIDAAAPNGDVLLKDGLYKGAGNKNLSFRGKSIAVHSQNGPGGVAIDCEKDGRGFVFDQGETDGAQLRGIAIRNGMATNGGAIYSSNASPRIEGCYLYDNVAFGSGGAVYAEGSQGPRLARCTIWNNAARIVWDAQSWGGQGAALYSRTETSARVEDSHVSGNRGESTAAHTPASGAIQGEWEAVRCTVVGHTNHFMAGLLDLPLADECFVHYNAFGVSGVELLRNSRIHKNLGAGVVFTRPGLATGCLISKNLGAGISCGGAPGWANVEFSQVVSNGVAASCGGNLMLRIADCRIAGNDTGSDACMGTIQHERCSLEDNGTAGAAALGGVLFESCLIRNTRGQLFTACKGGIFAKNCTLVDNGRNVTNGPTLFHGGYNGSFTLQNSIAWNNGTNLYAHDYGASSNFHGLYSLIQHSSTLYTLGEGCLDEDPQFVSTADFRLRPTSPCIGAGSAAHAPANGDLDGNDWDSPPSMGAYAFRGAAASSTEPAWSISSFQTTSGTADSSAGKPRSAVQIGWDALPNRTYSLLRSTNLLLGFQPARTIESGAGGPFTWEIDVDDLLGPAVFYRIETSPAAE